jgi:hypothetical protein
VTELEQTPLNYATPGVTGSRPRPKPRYGVASLLCLIASPVLKLTVIGIGYLIWMTYPEERMLERIWYPFAIPQVCLLIHLVGTVLGLAGIRRTERRIIAAFGGFVMNLMVLAWLLWSAFWRYR